MRLVSVCHNVNFITRIFDKPSSVPSLWTEQKRKTKAKCVGQVVTSSVKEARIRHPHGTVPCFVPAGTEQDAFSLNELNSSTIISWKNLYSTAENQRVYIHSSAWRAATDKCYGMHDHVIITRVVLTNHHTAPIWQLLRDLRITHHASRAYGCGVLKNQGLISRSDSTQCACSVFRF